MALLLDHEAVNITPGTRNFGPVAVPDGVASVKLRLARKTTATPTFWADGVSVQLASWCSIDGGATWLEWLGFGATGGNFNEMAESSAASALPAGAARQIKLTMTVAGGTLVSQLTLEVT